MAKSFDRDAYSASKRSVGSKHRAKTTRAATHASGSANPRYRKMRAIAQAQARSGASASVDSTLAAAAPTAVGTPVAFVSGSDAAASASDDISTRDTSYSRGIYEKKIKAKHKKHKTWKKVLVGCLIAVSVLAAGTAGALFVYLHNLQENFQTVDEGVFGILDNTVEEGDPFYMLLMGVDKSEVRADDEEFAGIFRTDSMILVRIDPKEKQVTAVSLMRDIMVDMGDFGIQKLNAAYAFGGAPYAIEVISEMAGVSISHYAEIDFDGFAEVIDAIGGIEVNVPIEIDDDEAGGYLSPGPQTLNGAQALVLCRSRHSYDDYGDGDYYRAANQRLVISAMVKKILSSDIPTMLTTIQTLSNYVATDMNVQDILSLAVSMYGLDTDNNFYSGATPTEAEYINDVWWEILLEDEWTTMMRRVDMGLPPVSADVIDDMTGTVLATAGTGEAAAQATKVHRTGTVSIRNGTDIDGAAASAQVLIEDMGYTVDTGNANGSFSETVVVYEEPDQAEYAQEIADTLGIGRIIQNQEEYLYDTDFLVVIGADWPH